MKKILNPLLIILIGCIALGLQACDKEDNEPTLEDIVGTWKLTEISTDGGKTFIPWPFETTTATFKANGKYYGAGHLGTGSGTWKQKGNIIYTYFNGIESIRYEIIARTELTCTLVMSDHSGSIWIKCIKY